MPSRAGRAPKLILCVIDSLHPQMLERAVTEGTAPTLERLIERGVLVPGCVSAFPSVTPVCCASITTGTANDRHRIPAMTWYHRGEERYVEYGSSLAATRAVGFTKSLYDVVYHMNLGHLSPHVTTVFEHLDDAGMRTACTPFLSYRGRTRHRVGLEGLLRRVAEAADFDHAVWGPAELFYGELYASRRVPCRPTLGRPNQRDEYSGCVGEELVARELFDFMLFSLPDNDHFSHRYGPEGQVESIGRADAQLARLVEAGGGLDAFLHEHAVIVMADHSQTEVSEELALNEQLSARWRVRPAPLLDPDPDAELAVCPSARSGSVYVLDERDAGRWCARLEGELGDTEGVDLVAWREGDDAAPLTGDRRLQAGAWTAVRSPRGRLRFRPATDRTEGAVRDRRGVRWELEGELACLEAEQSSGQVASEGYPDALTRLGTALDNPHAGDLLLSLAPDYECVDLGGDSHVPGGSHGALHAGDSLAPLLFVGCGPDAPGEPERWSLRDVACVVLGHFGLGG